MRYLLQLAAHFTGIVLPVQPDAAVLSWSHLQTPFCKTLPFRHLVAMHCHLFVLQGAAISKGGEVLSQWLHISMPAAALLFTAALGALCYRLVAFPHQWRPLLTASYQ